MTPTIETEPVIKAIGIVKALRKALADYTANVGGASSDPTVDKEKLIERVYELLSTAEMYLQERDFSLQGLMDAKDFAKLGMLQTAANKMCETLEIRKTFCTYATELIRLLKYCDRNDLDEHARRQKDAIVAIYDELQKQRKHSDNTDLMVQINQIVNEYIEVEPNTLSKDISKRFDISQIDFDLLRREFAKAEKKNLILKDLETLVQQRLDQMMQNNPSRIDYYERYQEIISAYNAEQDRATIEKTFMDLMDLANSMDAEQQRYVREGFSSDEELSLYDLLFVENLTKQEIQSIKNAAITLLEKIKSKIAELDHWTDKQETKAAVDNLIRDTLWAELPECYDEISIGEYRQKIYEYVYMRYRDVA